MKFNKIYIEITNICNKDCSFCSKNNRLLKEMSLKEFEIVLKRIDKFTDYVYLHIKGEPLLHKDFVEIINLCNKYNKKVNITTNGSLLNKYLELFKNESSVRQINISIHSTNNDEEITKIIKNVEIIRKYNKKIYIVYRYWTLNYNDDNYLRLRNIIKEIYKKDINDEMNVKLDDNLYINKDYEFIWPNINNSINKENGFCYGLKTHIGILSDGTVVPCCLDCDGIINLGNVFNDTLENILNNKRTKNIINNFKNNKRIENLCQHCSFKK